jgi:hypothetical protein
LDATAGVELALAALPICDMDTQIRGILRVFSHFAVMRIGRISTDCGQDVGKMWAREAIRAIAAGVDRR